MGSTACTTAKYEVEAVDYQSPQRTAQILIGDPQIYARASLINDRRGEIEYLEQLLRNSAVGSDGKSFVAFAPQVVRDLKTVEALTGSFGLNIGKTTGGSPPAITELNQQIETSKLRVQLAVLEKQLQSIEAADVPKTIISAPDTTASANAAAPKTVLSPDVTALQAQIKAIQAQLTTLTAVAPASAPNNNYGPLADPRDDFGDRQTYRRDIRAAIAAAQLDNVHDRGGNALYRLQFQATVLPPNGSTRQWGAVKLKVNPPNLTWKEVEAKYYNWLSYVTTNLSTGPKGITRASKATPHNYDYDRYVSRLESAGYFQIVDLFTNDSESTKRDVFCLMHSTATDALLRFIDAVGPKEGAGFITERKTYWKIGTYAIPPQISSNSGISTQVLCRNYPSSMNSPIRVGPPLPAETADFIAGVIKPVDIASPYAGKFNLRDFAYRPLSVRSDNYRNAVPDVFCRIIVRVSCETLTTGASYPAVGGNSQDGGYLIRSYSVLPTQLTQRLGVTTEASQSLQTALSIAAQVSTASKAGLDAGYLSQSDARAEALSRQPLVVGNAGTAAAAAVSAASAPAAASSSVSLPTGSSSAFFGWLFGPQFAVEDSKKLSLRQTVNSYGVSADLSVPGWWNSLSLDVKTAWVENWGGSGASQVLNDSMGPDMSGRTVYLPALNAIYDSLTDFIVTQEFGQTNSGIFASYVQPDVITSCSKRVTFQIGGTNIWRANAIYLAGAKAKTITVLPDMNGVTAEFDMADVYGISGISAQTIQTLPLLVSAEQGSAAALEVLLVGTQASGAGTTCSSVFLAATSSPLLPPTLVAYSPKEVCADQKEFPILLEGLNFPARFIVESSKFSGESFLQVEGTKQQVAMLRVKPGAKLSPNEPVGIFLISDDKQSAMKLELTAKECKSSDTAPKAKATAPMKTPSGKSSEPSAPNAAASASPPVTAASEPKHGGRVNVLSDETVPSGSLKPPGEAAASASAPKPAATGASR